MKVYIRTLLVSFFAAVVVANIAENTQHRSFLLGVSTGLLLAGMSLTIALSWDLKEF